MKRYQYYRMYTRTNASGDFDPPTIGEMDALNELEVLRTLNDYNRMDNYGSSCLSWKYWIEPHQIINARSVDDIASGQHRGSRA